ncbi:unnamed protein product [Cylindrotheca closterium]|uniref:Uncharacterized protein n=1 Tax=Cylindrotheca closterium TaxID=2856 RepID=A0AAD2GCC2_9STRA|nr:unnamed protein product [Cylindrotheca closterium]
MTYRIQTEGVRLRGQYTTPMEATLLQNEYNNHPAWVFDTGKGQICIDCSNGPNSLGSINLYIPSPKDAIPGEEDECPAVYYQYAFDRFLRRILRMRITRPNDPIMVHADDIEAAFRRVLYHPDMACAFAYVYSDYLMVPVGQVFGSRSAPSYYCVLADVRQALAACRQDEPLLLPLVASCTYEVDTSSPLVQVPPDSNHPPLTLQEQIGRTNRVYYSISSTRFTPQPTSYTPRQKYYEHTHGGRQ